jgi:hypothetical protein
VMSFFLFPFLAARFSLSSALHSSLDLPEAKQSALAAARFSLLLAFLAASSAVHSASDLPVLVHFSRRWRFLASLYFLRTRV